MEQPIDESAQQQALLHQAWSLIRGDWALKVTATQEQRIQACVEEFQSYCEAIAQEQLQERKGKIGYITYSMLRTAWLEERPAYLVEASDALWLLDPEPIRFEHYAEWAFAYWSELKRLLRTEAEKQHVSLTDLALERLMLEAAVHLHALVVNVLRLAMKRAVRLPEFQKMQREEAFEIRVAEYLDQSVSVYKEDRRTVESDVIQAWLEEKEEFAYSYQALTQVQLPDGDYSLLDFRYTAFRHVGMERSRLHACVLVGTVWQDCRLEETDFTFSLLHGADFSGCSMNKARFDAVIGDTPDGPEAWPDWEPLGFSPVDFTGAGLPGASFRDALLQEAVFRAASLQRASFDGADLTGACFAGADVTGASFTDARLAKADFTGAKVQGVRFTEEQLSEAMGLTERTASSPSPPRPMDIRPAEVTSQGGTTAMRYFRLRMDARVQHRVEPASLSPLEIESILADPRSQTEDSPLLLPVHTNSQTVFPDFLEFPVPLVSDPLKGLLEKIDPGLEWQAAILTDFQQARQEVYWVLRPPKEDCLSSQTEWYPNRTLKHVVLQYGTIESPIFRIAGLLEPYIYIDLAVAESLLRRPFVGIHVQRTEMATKEEESQ